MRSISIVALSFLAAPAISQSCLDLYPGTTSFSSRGDVGTGSGETLQGFHKSNFYGVGDNGTTCALQGFKFTVQDQDSSTQESFHIVVRAGTDANGPTTGSAASALLARIGPVTLPVVASGGSHAWTITVNLTTPATIPCEDFFAFGAELTTAPTFPTDGMGTHVAADTTADQHANAVDNAWQIIGAATSAVHPANKRSWRYAAVLAGPTLQMGNNAKYGNGGLFPAVTGAFSGRIEGGTPNGMSLLYMDIAIAPGFVLFPNSAKVYLPGAGARLLTAISLDANGDGVHALAPVPSVSPPIRIYFQTAITGGTGPQLSSVAATTFDQ